MSLLPDEKPVPLPRENPFRAMTRLLKSSLGKLPAHLVIIFFSSLAVTALFGIVLRVSEIQGGKNSAYLAERLSPKEDAAPLNESLLSGTWVSEMGDYIVTLRLANGTFEIISRYKPSPFSRYFIRGGYRSEGNVLILQERKDLGTPIDREHLEYKFYPLSIKTINLYAQTNGQVMVWETPRGERNRLSNPEPIVAQIFGERAEWVKILPTP